MAKSKKNREDRRRRREYEARVAVNDRQRARRRRDNVVASIAFVVVAALAAVGQVLFATGAFAPQPAAAPDPALAEGRSWTGAITFNDGLRLEVELDGAAAPQAVANAVSLSASGFYDGTSCHRLTTQGLFVLQCGDPEGTGQGGPGYSWGPVENAPEDGVYPAGTIAMARVGGDGFSMGSQFFIVYEDTELPSDEAGGYTVMGRVTGGLDQLVEQIAAPGVLDGSGDGAPAAPAVITSYTLQ
ncbi:MAG: peptidylprolyl isomerase [Pseudoclavibacter sp.]|nr:peptidylprolyl isomerase [Pseudoclavibacter sp.]